MTRAQNAESAYWRFFTTYNDRSPSGRAEAMSYPHVRVAAGRDEPVVTNTAAEYEQLDNWSTVEQQGWAYTQPITPRVVHRSPDKVHFAGGWTRHRADGSEISRNRLLYIVTEMDGGWGTEAAFGVEGALTGDEAAAPAAAAMEVLERTMSTLAAGDIQNWLDCFHYPSALILAPGMTEILQTRADAERDYGPWVAMADPIEQTASVFAVGPRGALIEQHITRGGDTFEQCFLVVEREGVWAASAVSAVRPYG